MSVQAHPRIHGRWQVFSAAPHRMLFLGGVTQIVLVMLLWAAELAGRAGGGWALPWNVPPFWAHTFLMVYGLFPFFIFGFLLTVYPRWMGGEAVRPARYIPVFVALAAGMALVYAGFFSTRYVLAAGAMLCLLGWATAYYTLFDVYRRAPQRGPHEAVLNAALAAGIAGQIVFLHGVLADQVRSIALARDIGLWLFLLPVLFTVSHRMIPFFSSTVLPNYTPVRPAWALSVLVAGALGHFAFEVAALVAWRFIFDLPMAAAALYLTWAWKLRRSFAVRLLAMLHVAFLWFGLGMALEAAQSLAWLITGQDVFGRAALHALGIGFVTGMLVAMASRVTLGHSGLPLAADRFTWWVFAGVNVVALLRIAAEFAGGAGGALNTLAALAWLVVLWPWVSRYAPIYLRPRADGKPG
ncbi:MAG: NnrS family protein [Gammaproteobacteria bacterium]|nr:MAG: NnrS family protein [Gammaproteobacteria bacterium]